MVVMALPPARGSGGHSSTMSLAVSMSPRRFRAMVISVPIFSVLLRLVFASLTWGSHRVSAERFGGFFSGFFRRRFRYSGAAGSRGFGWSRGLFSGPAFRPAGGPGLPRLRPCCRGAAGPPPGLPESWPGGRLFCPFWPSFSGPEGVVGGPGRGPKLPDREKRTCVKKVRGGIQLRVVGFTRLALCNERSFRTDVNICTIFSYGSARAGV